MTRDMLYSSLSSCLIHLALISAAVALNRVPREIKKEKVSFTEVSFERIEDARLDNIMKRIKKIRKRTPAAFTLPGKIKTGAGDNLSEASMTGTRFKKSRKKISGRTLKSMISEKDISGSSFPQLKTRFNYDVIPRGVGRTSPTETSMPDNIEKGGFLKSRRAEKPVKEFREKNLDFRTGSILSETASGYGNKTETTEESGKTSGYGNYKKQKEMSFPANLPETKDYKDDVPSFDSRKIQTARQVSNGEESVFVTGSDTGVGISITGEIRSRKVLESHMPEYPPWLAGEGIEPVVVLRFTVLPDGHVKDRIFIKRTSGYRELDRLVINEMKKWVFAPVRGANVRQEETGEIIFRFSLK